MKQLYRKVIADNNIHPNGLSEPIPESELLEVERPTGRLQQLGDALMQQVIENRQKLKEKKEAQRKMWASMALD